MLSSLCMVAGLVMEVPSLDVSIVWLARAIEGEGASLFGDQREEVGRWIAHTALNRLESPHWPDTMETVVCDGFYGHRLIDWPAPWAMRLARDAMARKTDVTGGALFMLSSQDLAEHGWSTDGELRSFRKGHWELHFYRRWPGGDADGTR